jgi:Tfp pilus assembly protein PilX
MIRKNNDGYILITVLLLLLVLTILGMAAINTSTVENLLSGNIRLRETNISKADAGADMSGSVIERTIRTNTTSGFANIIQDSNIADELRVTAFDNDSRDVAGELDVGFTVGGQNITIDIDKMYSKFIGGTAIEFAAGYEGAGKSGGSGFYTFYRINSTGFGLVFSDADVGTIYRYVPK